MVIPDGSSRLLFTNESSATEQNQITYDDLSRSYVVELWWPRVVGLVTMMSAVTILSMAWNRRKFVFHRLVLGMAIHQFIYGLMYSLGTLLIPREYDEYYGNFGTIGTCDFQGFALYIGTRSSAIYYGLFCIYGYVATLNDFDKNKYQWVEKWIHIVVHFYTLSTGSYSLAVEGYNPVRGYCKMASYPLDCETSDDVVCERGPASFGKMKATFWLLIPNLIYLMLPTVTMTMLYFKVKKREEDHGLKSCLITSKDVAIQSCVYLSAIYVTTLPFLVSDSLEYLRKVDDESLTPLTLASKIIYALFAFWTMLTYWYFSIDRPNDRSADKAECTSSKKRKTSAARESQLIFNAACRTTTGDCANTRVSKISDSPTTETNPPTQLESEPAEERRYSFNIFDGTNACGAFADFIHDADSEDERLEREETDRWNSVQEHV